jgi:hypothetical protein
MEVGFSANLQNSLQIPGDQGILAAETGSRTTASATTQFGAAEEFLSPCEKPRIGGVCREHLVSAKGEFDSGGSFGALFSGLEIPFPGNGDRGRQRPVRLSRFCRSETQHLELARPFGRHVAKTRYSHATR